MIFGVILCVGDSLLTGARDELGLSVPKILGDELSSPDQSWIAVDEGVNGETSGMLTRRLYKVVRSYPEAVDVVVSVGTNDAKTPGLDSNCFYRNYGEILRIITILHRHCYACLIPSRRGFGAPDYLNNELISNYNTVIRNMSSSCENMTIVDWTGATNRHRPDGVHFSNSGNKWAAKKLASTIRAARS